MGKKSIRSQLMDVVECMGPIRRTDIIKYLRIVIQGKSYDPIRDRGYYSVAFRKLSHKWSSEKRKYVLVEHTGYLMHPVKNDNRYFVQLANKKYKVVKG